MRKIKFRAQDIASNKWLYGDLRHHKDDVCIFEQEGNKGEQVKRDTIWQFVGLKDKNGKEIYEGDIISVAISDVSENKRRIFATVEWCDTEFGGYCKDENTGWNLFWLWEQDQEIEIIGNIHDNKDLTEHA